MSNAWSPAGTGSEAEVLNLSLTPVIQEASLSSYEEGGSSSLHTNESTSKSTRQRRGRRTAWTEAARLELIQQVHHEKPYLLGHGQVGKAWENIASALSTKPPFAEAGGIKAVACTQKYTAMLKDHREKVAKGEGEGESGKREGECEAVVLLLNECMVEEQGILEEREKKQGEGKGKEKEKDAIAEKPEASLAPADSLSCISELREGWETFDGKPTSSSSSYSALESTVAGYLTSPSDSPNTRRRKVEAQFLDAKRRLEEFEMMRRIVASEESPETKRRRKDIEASDAAARLLNAENRKLDLERRLQEVKATQALQEGALKLIAKLIGKSRGDP